MPVGIAFKGDSIALVIYKGGAAAQADGDATQYGIKRLSVAKDEAGEIASSGPCLVVCAAWFAIGLD